MAISNLVAPQGQSFNRPGVSAFFGAGNSPANDNVQKVSSSMFDETFFTNVLQALTSLGSELTRVQETANKTVLGLNKVISSLKDLSKGIAQRFGALNSEISAGRVDMARNMINAPAAPALDDGLPVIVAKDDKPATPAAAGAGFPDVSGLLGFMPLLTKLGAFFASPLGIGLLAGSLAAYGIYEFIGKSIRERLSRLGITDDMPQEEISRRLRADNAERKEAPYRDMAQLRMLAEQVMNGNHDAELGIKPEDNAAESDKIRKKVAEDLLLPVPIIHPKLTNSIPKLPTREERKATSVSEFSQLDYVAPSGVQAPPAPSPTKGMTPAQKSQYNRDQARKSQQGAPTPAAPAPSAPAPQSSNTTGSDPNAKQVGGRDLDQNGMQEDTGIDVGQHDEELKMTGLPLKVSRELSGDSAYKQGEINRYVTDPRPDVPLGSVADLMFNGNENDRKKRYLDYQTNPDAAGKTPMQAGYQFSGLQNQYDSNGNLTGSRSRTKVSFSELAERAARPEVATLGPGEGIMDRLSPGMRGYGSGGATVINTSSSTNIGSTEGGEANNLAGTNLPLSATNPHIQEFLAKQNIQYQ